MFRYKEYYIICYFNYSVGSNEVVLIFDFVREVSSENDYDEVGYVGWYGKELCCGWCVVYVGDDWW